MTIRYIRTRFLDSKNISGFDTSQFEGPVGEAHRQEDFYFSWGSCRFLGFIFRFQDIFSPGFEGEKFTARSERNSFKKENITPLRGAIYDNNETALVWNGEEGRMYADIPGLGHTLVYRASFQRRF